jgi:hypothetical protein
MLADDLHADISSTMKIIWFRPLSKRITAAKFKVDMVLTNRISYATCFLR